MRPLADEIRPQTLDDVAGQKHLLGEGALLRRLIENGTDASKPFTKYLNVFIHFLDDLIHFNFVCRSFTVN